MITRVFLRDATERAIKSLAGGLLSYLTVAGVTVLDVDWKPALASSVTSALVSVLLSLVSYPVSGNGTASLVPQVVAESRGRHLAPEN